MRTITFSSYKGGVGQTLALANFAHYLANLGQRVIALDLDLETPGLHYKLAPPYSCGPLTLVEERPGTLDLFDAFAAHRPLPLQEALIPIRGDAPDQAGAISLISAGSGREGYWRRLATFPWRRLLCGGGAHESAEPRWDRRAGELLLTLHAELHQLTGADALLIDTSAGISELGDLASSLLASDVVLLLAHNPEGLDGTSALITALLAAPRLPSLEGPAPLPRIFPVLSRVPTLPEPEAEALLAAASTRLGCSADGPVQPPTMLRCVPALALHERLLLSEPQPPPATELLCADYLQLFARLVPAAIAEDELREQTEAALRLAYEDPRAAIERLEQLARAAPHPTSYRALLKLLRLTRALTPRALGWVQKLVKATGDPAEPLVHSVVQECVAMLEHEAELAPPWLEIAEQVWNAHARRWQLGVGLAAALVRAGSIDRAHHVLRAAGATLSDGEGAGLATVLQAMLASSAEDDARALLARHRRGALPPQLQALASHPALAEPTRDGTTATDENPRRLK